LPFLNTGTNTPLVIRGIEEYSHQKMDAVVKFRGARRMSKEASMRELLAAFIAKEWDISVVEPALINISGQFIQLLKGDDLYKIASKSKGLNFGSLYDVDKRAIAIHEPLNEAQQAEAKRIFCFDTFIINTDRRFDKPNMMTDGEEITIYDHEIAFSFVMDLIKKEEPWKLTENDITSFEKHCLYDKIKGKGFPEAFISTNIEKLDDEFWNRAEELAPDEWILEQFFEIKDYLSTIVNHKEQFITELKRVLA
jgi:hypothetical protein